MSRSHNGFIGLHRELSPPGFGSATQYNARRDPVTTTGSSIAFSVDVLNEGVGVASFPETLAERAADLPTPDYVQLMLVFHATANYDTSGGAISWDTPNGPGAAYYPFGVTETVDGEGTFTYEDQVEAVPPPASILSTWLRRPPDGDTYELDPTNDGIDTLFPWAEFIADPIVDAGVSATPFDLETLVADDSLLNGILIIARPWFRDVALPAPFMCVL